MFLRVELFVRRSAGFIVLLTILLFAGCTEEPELVDTGFIPLGEWADDFGGSYKISATNLEFDDGYGFDEFKGVIVEANDFSSNSGVLLVQVTSSTTLPEGSTGKFIGVYYKDYTESHVLLANAIDESYALIEVDTLTEARNTFTVDNVGTHVTYWGTGYNK